MTTVAGGPRHDELLPVPRTAAAIAGRAHLACVLEAGAPKPGNVSPGRPFADMCYEDFVASAEAIARPLVGAGVRALGETILLAVAATVARTRVNTNLGIVLLLTPLARAAAGLLRSPVPSRRDERLRLLRSHTEHVLGETTVDDARDVYRAIRLANPGGLGSAEEQDVSSEPTVTLLEAMRLASDRDGIAREYATGYATTFERSVPALLRGRADGLPLREAIVETFLTLVAAQPDTHIVRRGGEDRARHVSSMAAEALALGGVRTAAGRRGVAAMDVALRDSRNLGNPGTSADLTAAALFAALLVGGWSLGPLEGLFTSADAAQYDGRSEES
jgi:triphosphoribosyl-dephospho-CoA synthase